MKKFLLFIAGISFVFNFSPFVVFAGFDVENEANEHGVDVEEGSTREEFVEPREIKDALRQLNEIKREAQRTLKKAQKSANFVNEINELNTLLVDINNSYGSINNASGGSAQREALQEFYDAQLWETMNAIRIKIEFPNELKMIERDLKKLEKLVSSKNFSLEKVDANVIPSKIHEIKSAIAEARNFFNQGDFEEAREALSVVHEGSHPGEIISIAHQLREINKRLKSVKKEVKEEFHEVLSPVYEAFNNGDFQEANMMMSDISNDLWRLLDKLKNKRSGLNNELQNKLRGLEERLQNKQQQIQKQEEQNAASEPQSLQPYKPYRASSIDSLKNILGF